MLKNYTSGVPVERTISRTRSPRPVQPSGRRFEYRILESDWQIYGDGLTHVCLCSNEDIAKLVSEALNAAMPPD